MSVGGTDCGGIAGWWVARMLPVLVGGTDSEGRRWVAPIVPMLVGGTDWPGVGGPPSPQEDTARQGWQGMQRWIDRHRRGAKNETSPANAIAN